MECDLKLSVKNTWLTSFSSWPVTDSPIGFKDILEPTQHRARFSLQFKPSRRKLLEAPNLKKGESFENTEYKICPF